MADPSDMNAAFSAAVAQKAANESNTAAFQQAVEAKKAAEQQAETVARLKQRYGEQAAAVEKARAATVAWGRSLRDGTAVRAARDLDRLRREEEKYRREVDLRSRYGRAGGFVARHERGLGYAEAAASRAMGTVNGLYQRGMSGTVEQGRRDLEMNLLGREVAAIFKPVSDATTDLIRGFRKLLGGLGGSGQNALLAGGLLTAGGLGIAGLARGGHLGGLGRLALGGGAAAAGLAGGLGIGEIAAGAMGLKMLGGSRGGSPAPSPGVADMMREKMFGPSSPTAPKPGWGASAMKWLGRATVPIAAASEAHGYYSDYKRRTESGDSGLMAATKGALELQANMLTFGLYGHGKDMYKSVKGAMGGDETDTRRRVMMQGGGFQESGSGYDQIAEAFGRVYGGEEAKKSEESLGKIAGLVGEMNKMIAATLASADRLKRPGE